MNIPAWKASLFLLFFIKSLNRVQCFGSICSRRYNCRWEASIFASSRGYCRQEKVILAALIAKRRVGSRLFLNEEKEDENSKESTRTNISGDQQRKKKNKYAKFSKIASSTNTEGDTSSSSGSTKDPWDLLIEESQRKNKKLEMEKAWRQNKIKKQDLQDLLLDENDNDTARRTKRTNKRKRNSMIFPNATQINPYDPTTFGYIELGTIIGPHGVYGHVKISSTTDFSEKRLCSAKPTVKHLKLPTRRSPREILLLEGKPQIKDLYILKFEGIGTREDALQLKGSVLYAREEEEKPQIMGKDEYFITDLVGLAVFLIENNDDSSSDDAIGFVKGIILQEDVGSVALGYDFLEISLASQQEEHEQLVMIPFVPQIVTNVDTTDKRCIYIDPPEGLLDLTFVRQERVTIKGFLPPARD